MSASQSGVFNTQQFTDLGAPLVGGRLYTYVQGTTTQKAAYTDHAGTIPHTYTSDVLGGQYIALNARGELPAPLYLAAGSYDLALKTAAGATVWTRRADPVWDITSDLSTSTGSSLVGFIQSGTGAAARTVQDELRETVKVTQFGADPAGVTNSTTAFTNAKAISRAVYVPVGNYIVDPSITKDGLYGPGILYDSVTSIASVLPASVGSGNSSTLSPMFVDLHYGICKGTPLVAGESSNYFTLASTAVAGATTLTFSGFAPVQNQLLAIKGSDGNYRTITVKSVVGLVATLAEALPYDITDLGGHQYGGVTSFYNNSGPHPNIEGYNAIADYPFLNGFTTHTSNKFSVPANYGAGVVSATAGNNIAYVGGATTPGYQVVLGGAGGCTYTLYPKTTGKFLLRLKINTQGNAVNVSAYTATSAGNVEYINASFTSSSPRLLEVPVWVQNGIVEGAVTVLVTASTGTFYVGKAELCEFEQIDGSNINWGKHVLIGDSWLAQLGIAARLQVRLPNATIVNKGVGGYKASDLLNFFNTTVVAEKPDFVWVMVGTNDAAVPVSADLFAYYIQKLKTQIQANGATPIFFNPSVGSILVNPSYFDYSRQYADLVPYIDQALGDGVGTWTPTDTGFTKSATPTFTGVYHKAGKMVHCELNVNANSSGTVAAVAGTSYVRGLPFPVANNSVCFGSNGAIGNLGTGLVYAPTGTVYVPAWVAAAGTTNISFTYLTL